MWCEALCEADNVVVFSVNTLAGYGKASFVRYYCLGRKKAYTQHFFATVNVLVMKVCPRVRSCDPFQRLGSRERQSVGICPRKWALLYSMRYRGEVISKGFLWSNLKCDWLLQFCVKNFHRICNHYTIGAITTYSLVLKSVVKNKRKTQPANKITFKRNKRFEPPWSCVCVCFCLICCVKFERFQHESANFCICCRRHWGCRYIWNGTFWPYDGENYDNVSVLLSPYMKQNDCQFRKSITY